MPADRPTSAARIRPVGEDRTGAAAALTILFGDLEADERVARVAEVLDHESRGTLSLAHLLLAEVEGRAVGAALSMVQPDGTGFVWPPVACLRPHSASETDRADQAAALVDDLLHATTARLDAAGVWIGQCLLETERTDERAAMQRNGYLHLTDLAFLERSLIASPTDSAAGPASASPAIGTSDPEDRAPRDGHGRDDAVLDHVAFAEGPVADEFAATIERSYVGTQDCPELCGCRTGREALVGHRDSGGGGPACWRLYRIGREPVGVLLMNSHEESGGWELTYLGIVPERRGQGHARRMVEDGLRAAREAGRTRVCLAVDRRNSPALKLYRACGFVEVAVRAVHARFAARGPRTAPSTRFEQDPA